MTLTTEALDALEKAHENLDSLLAQAIRFIETLSDNDPDDLIADNGMTVVGALQFKAPPLSFAMRAARNNLPALIEAARERDALQAENERLRNIAQPEWFYLAGDMSSDCCRFSVDEVIDEDWFDDSCPKGAAVVQIETATRCPDIWCAVRFFTDEEKDARESDDDYELTEHPTEDAARAALAGEPQ